MGVLLKMRSNIMACLGVYLADISTHLPLTIRLLHRQPKQSVILLQLPLRQLRLPRTEMPLSRVFLQTSDNR
jgi:hypothetical protein